jgi:hypothetical protein
VDPTIPTACEFNMQMFDVNDTEIWDLSVSNNVAYYKCRPCDDLTFDFYYELKRHAILVHNQKGIGKEGIFG